MTQRTTYHQKGQARHAPVCIFIAVLAVGLAALGLWQVRGAVQGKSAGQLVAAIEQAAAGKQAGSNPAAAPTYQTATVQRGNLSLSASGSGSLIPAQSVDLNFTSSGSIAQLNVKIGDQVTAGQVLAVQDGIDALKQTVDQKQLDLLTAQNALDQLTSNSQVNLAQAASDLAAAQQTYNQAQNGLHTAADPRCAPSLTEQYYWQYLSYQVQAQPWVNALGNPKTGYSHDYIMQNLNPIKAKENQAYYNWQWCQSYTDLEIQASQAALQVAQANMHQAQVKYQALQGNQGVDPNALALAQATLTNAQKQFDKAKADLDGATIVAPISGTVTAVTGDQLTVKGSSQSNSNQSSSNQSGSGANSSGANSDANTPLISIADTNHPEVQVNIDETDLDSFASGCPAQVTFSALPNQTFTGTVAQVYPSLATVNNASEAQGLVQLAQKTSAGGKPFPIGLDAQVTVTCQQAANALLVPTQALHQSTDGQTNYVYLLNAQGQPEKHTVQVGIRTTAFAEIKSGLKAGDTVITSGVKE